MNIFGRTLAAAVGAIVLTATAVALPDVCQLKAPVTTELNRSVTNNDVSQTDAAANILPAHS